MFGPAILDEQVGMRVLMFAKFKKFEVPFEVVPIFLIAIVFKLFKMFTSKIMFGPACDFFPPDLSHLPLSNLWLKPKDNIQGELCVFLFWGWTAMKYE